MNKPDLSDKINEILGIDLFSLERMTKEDLEAFLEYLGNPANLIKTGVKQLRAKARHDLLERPLKELLEKPFLGKLTDRENDEKGPLGFGVLPRILKVVRPDE